MSNKLRYQGLNTQELKELKILENWVNKINSLNWDEKECEAYCPFDISMPVYEGEGQFSVTIWKDEENYDHKGECWEVEEELKGYYTSVLIKKGSKGRNYSELFNKEVK